MIIVLAYRVSAAALIVQSYSDADVEEEHIYDTPTDPPIFIDTINRSVVYNVLHGDDGVPTDSNPAYGKVQR